MARLPPSGLILGDGVNAKLARIDFAKCQMSGPGARILMATWGMPGMRQPASIFPALPDGWAAAIDGALNNNGRLLKAGAGQPKASAIVSRAAAIPPVAAPHPKSAPAVSRESQRRAAYAAKFSGATNEMRARVNKLIANGTATLD
jgi:hypothetical protein